jgi:hypothetical protein
MGKFCESANADLLLGVGRGGLKVAEMGLRRASGGGLEEEEEGGVGR